MIDGIEVALRQGKFEEGMQLQGRVGPVLSAVVENVRPLLADTPNLLEEFMQFVPDSCMHTGYVHYTSPYSYLSGT